MKKILFVLLVCIIFISCSGVKNDIKTKLGNDVEKLSVKTIKINDDFFSYFQSYINTENILTDCEKSKVVIDNQLNELKESIKYWKKKGVTQYVKEDEESYNWWNNRRQNVISNIDSLTNVKNKLIKHKKGKLYVCKCTKNSVNSYPIFLHNENGELEQYVGDECFNIIFTTFPNSKVELQNALLNIVMD